MKRLFILITVLSLITSLAACSDGERSNGNAAEGAPTISVNTDFEKTPEDMFTDRDKNDSNKDTPINILLDGDSISVSSPLVSVSGSTVTVRGEGTFVFSGTLNNGSIIIEAAETDKPQIVLNGVSITSNDYASIYVKSCDKLFITLSDGTENTLSCGEAFVQRDENTVDGAIFSKQDLTLNGGGALIITSPAGHGIVCKDDLVITGGSYNITCASHGLDANDSVRITEATLELTSGKDGIHCENNEDAEKGFVYIESGSLKVRSEGDGISSGNYLQIDGGSFDIVSGGGSENGDQHVSDGYGGFPGSMGGGGGGRPRSTSSDSDGSSIKGLKADGSILIKGGSFVLDCADDAVHSNTSAVISGGEFEIETGDDGIHAEESLLITDGVVNIKESYEGLEALNVEINGGDITLIASDDGINAAGGNDGSGMGGFRPGGDFGGSASKGSIVISGGSIYMNASGDGIDANGSLTISGGYINVCGPTQGDTSVLDYDNSATITGGTFIGTGSYMMAQTFSSSVGQGVISLSVGNQSAGTVITLKDKNGNTLIENEPKLPFAIVILSSPDVKKGESYTIYIGEASGTFEAS